MISHAATRLRDTLKLPHHADQERKQPPGVPFFTISERFGDARVEHFPFSAIMKLLLLFLSLVAASFAPGDETPVAARVFDPPPFTAPAAVDYPALVQQIAVERRKLAARLQQEGASEKLLIEASLLYCRSFTLLAGQWMGTAWDFNGITQKPREGKIACGYFVTTLLRDAGFDVERSRLGQQASEVIAKTMTTREFIRSRSGESLEDFVKACSQHAPGVYLVGLDFHTGYLVNDGTGLWFVHAAYGKASRYVVVEKAAESAYLKISKFRQVAFLTEDRKFLLGWLNGRKWVTGGNR